MNLKHTCIIMPKSHEIRNEFFSNVSASVNIVSLQILQISSTGSWIWSPTDFVNISTPLNWQWERGCFAFLKFVVLKFADVMLWESVSAANVAYLSTFSKSSNVCSVDFGSGSFRLKLVNWRGRTGAEFRLGCPIGGKIAGVFTPGLTPTPDFSCTNPRFSEVFLITVKK